MAKKKDDLTRIEDLSEYIHQNENEDEDDGELLTGDHNADFSNDPSDGLSDDTLVDFDDESEMTGLQNDTSVEMDHEIDSIDSDTSFDESFPSIDDVEDELPSIEDAVPSEPDFTMEEEKIEKIDERPREEEEFKEFRNYQPPSPPIEKEVEKKVTPISKREDFSDIRNFGQNIAYGNVTASGNPPFSIIIRKIKYKEDAAEILRILREHGLVSNENETTIQQGINNGSLIISQINEYSAIYLAHKFRRFDLDILVGLADEIHPPKNYDNSYRGLINKENLFQNRTEALNLEEKPIRLESVILATTPTLQNYQILRYLGIITEHSIINEYDLERIKEVEQKQQLKDEELPPPVTEREISSTDEETPSFEVKQVYQQLAHKMQEQAFKMGGNAVVDINYQLTPLTELQQSTNSVQYKITCSGSVVCVSNI